MIPMRSTIQRSSNRLPAQNWFAIGAILGLGGAAVERWLGTVDSVALCVAWAVLWIASLTAARGLVARVLSRWRRSGNYGLWLTGLAGVLGASVLSAIGFFQSGNAGLATVLLRTCTGWFLTVAATPWLISKRPMD